MVRIWKIASLGAVAALAGGLFATPAAAAGAAGCPTLEITAVAFGQQSGMRELPTADGGAVWVSGVPLASARDVSRANVSNTGAAASLGLVFRANTATQIRTYMASHAGGLMTFVVGGRAIKVAKIGAPITGDTIVIAPVEPVSAARLAAGLNRCYGAK